MLLPLPLLDLGNTSEQELVQQLHEACSNHGFFLVSGHDIPNEVTSNGMAALKQFFDLPPATKASITQNADGKGYMDWGLQTLDLATQTCADTKEAWAVLDPCLSVDDADGDDGEPRLPFHSPNQWPSPADLPTFRTDIEALMQAIKGVSHRVNELLAQVLGVPRDFFAPYFKCPMDRLRGIHYHSTQGSDPGKGVMGAGAHTDWGHITYLMTDGCPGLQIHYQGNWLDVPHVPGAFVCNIADLLQLWSGGRFKSALHRVVVAPGAHRYSCAYFTVPAWDAWVTPLKGRAEGLEESTSGDVSAVSATHRAAEAASMLGTLVPTSAVPGSLAESTGGVQKRLEGGVLVTAEGCRLAPGAQGVRVVDYIKAKYKFHSIDVGKAAAVQVL